jgi:hypothetical protein
MGGMFKAPKPDTSGQEALRAQVEESKQENARLKAQTEEESRELAERTAAARRARQRGGARMLLSEARVAPETGIQTLGTAGTERSM